MQMVMMEPGQPAWEEAWRYLRLDMCRRIERQAWDVVRAEGQLDPVKVSKKAKEAMAVILTPPEFAGMPNEGEEWQYMGTEQGEYTCALTGISGKGWYHTFRHRCCPLTGARMYARYRANYLPPEPKAVLPIRAVTFHDNGQPF